MRPRPTSATNHQIVAVMMFLLTGCIWWRAAPFVKEEIGHVRTILGLESRSDPSFTSEVDDASAMSWPAPATESPMAPPAVGFHELTKTQLEKVTGRE